MEVIISDAGDEQEGMYITLYLKRHSDTIWYDKSKVPLTNKGVDYERRRPHVLNDKMDSKG